MIQVFVPIFIIIATYLYIRFKRHSGAPPGPFKFPILGNFPQIFLQLDTLGLGALFLKWSKKYGRVFSVDFGSYSAIIINDPGLIRDAFSLPTFSGRPHMIISDVRMGGDGIRRGLIFNEGQSWTEQRRFTMRHLKDFGVGKYTMEGIILDEAQDLIENFRKEVGKPISTQAVFNVAIINSLWTIVAGQRFKYDDPELKKLVVCVLQNLAEAGASGALIFLPTFAKMFPNLSGWAKYIQSFNVTQSFIDNFVQSRLNSHQDGHLNDFTDAYIENMHGSEQGSSFYKEEGIKNLGVTLNDMFNAGGETTSTTLSWYLLCLALNPKVQEKLQNEIDTVIGTDKFPSLGDRPKMPYTEAVISEVLRISSVVPVGVAHSSTQDTIFHRYFIPKAAVVFANIYGVHHDVSLWGDPHHFRPERFLSEDERSYVGHDGLIPFSIGKRVCIGENLARDQLFLISTSIFQAFNIKPDPSAPLPSLNPMTNGVVAKPQAHNLIFYNR